MRFYCVDGHHVSTLAEARTAAKEADDPDVAIDEVEVATDRETMLRLLNMRGGTHRYTGRRWKLGPRGGLVEITEGK